jgi:predicted Zn-dependent protease
MEEARAVFRKAIDEMPSDAALWGNYRATYLHEENYQAALPEFFRKR